MPKRRMTLDPELAAEAKSTVALAFRNGPIEGVHAGFGRLLDSMMAGRQRREAIAGWSLLTFILSGNISGAIPVSRKSRFTPPDHAGVALSLKWGTLNSSSKRASSHVGDSRQVTAGSRMALSRGVRKD